jgi:hypothetical protein
MQIVHAITPLLFGPVHRLAVFLGVQSQLTAFWAYHLCEIEFTGIYN